MKKIILFLSVIMLAVACSTPSTGIGANVMAQGSALYGSSDSAAERKLENKFYYFESTTVAVGTKVYSTSQTSSPLKGDGNWVCLTVDNKVWNTIQVGTDGVIIQIK